MTKSTHGNRPQSDIPVSPWRWLTRLAFLLAIAIVITRLTTVESLRDPWEATPGSTAVPRGAGPGAGLVLDLLAIMPALLILARRTFDPTFRLMMRPSFILMFALGMWCVLSTAWADDQFAAAVTSSHVFAGMCLLWAAAQLVRSAVRLRLVAAIAFGLLLVLVTQSVIYRFVDVPGNTEYWNREKATILRERNWQPDSFTAKQFEHKLLSGELVGFFNSANTFAAVGVMLFAISAGIGIQKTKDGDGPAWLALSACAAAAALWIIIEARSKTSGATPLLGIALFLAVMMLRKRFRRQSKQFYWIGVGGCLVEILAVVGHGIYHHGLFPGHFSNSLQFRWQYWIASVHMFIHHPVAGIGWDNFGLYYLASRLPSASEEIKDPHNFLVRTFVELGIVGGVLLLAWMLRAAWEITRPALSDGDAGSITHEDHRPAATIMWAIVIAVSGIVLSILVNIDFTQLPADITLELLRRLLYLLVLVLGTVVGSMLSPQRRELDHRPAPWIFYCIVIALVLFLVHNLIDFSLFEVGPMFAFLFITGSALGISPLLQSPQNEVVLSSRRWAVGIFLFILLAWIAAGIFFVAPVLAAEQSAYDANESIRIVETTDAPQTVQAHFNQAADDLQWALNHVPYNADYALRLSKALLMANRQPEAQVALKRAIAINPRFLDAYLLQANIELSRPHPITEVVMENFDAVVQLNPNDISLREQYGQALDRLGLHKLAAFQYERALANDAALPPGEPRHLSATEVADVQMRIKQDENADMGLE